MKNIKHIKTVLAIMLPLLIVLSSCKKYLDLKPNQALVTIKNANDLQALLDDNYAFNGSDNTCGEFISDNYFILDDFVSILYQLLEPGYLFDGSQSIIADTDYEGSYYRIRNTNLVLDNIDKVSSNDEEQKKFIKGQAYFWRGYSLFKATQVFTLPYDKNTAGSSLGLPLVTTIDITATAKRAKLSETFNQIIADLKQAAILLPINSNAITRPNLVAANACLASVYLVMGDYDLANQYAETTLKLQHSLIDYNSLDPNSNDPIPYKNQEVILQTKMLSATFMDAFFRKVSPELLLLYKENDLRRQIFYYKNSDDTYSFKGSYDGNILQANLFSGLAVDEVMLIKAECAARLGDKDAALSVLNTLLKNRIDHTFIPVTAQTSDQALDLVLLERRKELAFRGGLRWLDLRRLNLDPSRAVTISRTYLGKTYTLPPNDLRDAFLLPQQVITLSGMEQNKR